MGASLTLDHVNYLIWRYLQEQGFGKSAVQMSREWKLSDPTALPFADNVPPYALIQMLQDALAYDTLVLAAQKAQDTPHPPDELSTASTDPSDSPARPRRSLDKRYDFVNVKTRPISFRPEHSLPVDDDPTKRVKKPRPDVRRKPSRPAGPTTEARANGGDAMDIDHDDDGQLQPDDTFEEVVQEEPPLPLIHTLEIGQSQGFQIEEEKEDEKLAPTAATHIMPGSEILGLNWNSGKDDKLLVTGGSAWHSLSLIHAMTPARNETLPEPGDTGPPVGQPEYAIEAQNHYHLTPTSYVTKFLVSQAVSAATAEGGTIHAHAVEELHNDGTASGTVIMSSDDGPLHFELEKPTGTVTALCFDQTATHVVVVCIAEDGDVEPGSDIRIWETKDRALVGSIACSAMVRDACWTGNGVLIVCGEKMLDVFSKEDGRGFELRRSVETDRDWEQVRFDADSNQVACISGEDGTLGLLDLTTFELSTVVAQESSISSIRWQPLPRRHAIPLPDADNDHPMENSTEPVAPKLLATSSSIDCNVKLWNTNAGLSCLATLSTKNSQPVWAFDFSPDGSRIAAACGDMVTVWKADAEGEVVARWRDIAAADQQAQELHPRETNGEVNGAVTSPITNGNGSHSHEPSKQHRPDEGAEVADDTRSEDGLPPYHCIAWDREGKRLAHGIGQKITIIELPAP